MSPETTTTTTTAAVAAALVPGHRFHPSDQELVCYFLKRKVCGKLFPFEAISEIDIYKFEPWDLPGLSRPKGRDLVWYFFCSLKKKYGSGPQTNCTTERVADAQKLKKRKYGSGPRTNRTTKRGFWKSTGEDRPVKQKARIVGMKKTLVFHIGRAPDGEKTDWFMHEFRLEDNELREAGIQQDAFVVCRVFQKNGSGSENGEHYWAPFVEEEWDDNVLVPHKESGNEGSFFDTGEQSSVQPIDHEQNSAMGVMDGNAAPVMEFNGTDSCNNSEDPVGFLEGAHAQNFHDGMGENPNLRELHENRELFIGVGESTVLPEAHGDQDLFSGMGETIMSLEVYQTKRFNDENYIELNDIVNTVEADCRNGEIVDNHLMNFDAPAHNQPPIGHGYFLEMNDLLNTVEADSSGFEMFEDLLMYFDATDSTLDQLNLSMENPAMGVTYENAAPVMGFNGTDSCNNSVDAVGFLEGTHAYNIVDDLGENPNLRELHDNRELSIGVGENTVLPEELGDQDFFSIMDETIISREVYQTSRFNDGNYIELSDIVNTVEADCSNAPAHNQPPIRDGCFQEMDGLLNLVEADSLGFEMLDDLPMYFDATDNNLDYESLGSSCKHSENVDSTLDQLNLSMEADGGTLWSYPAYRQSSKAPDMEGASSSQKLEASGVSSDENAISKETNLAIAPDVQNEVGWNKSLTKRFCSLLDSIPSPPAFAAEYAPKGSAKSIQKNAANNSSSIHVNAEAFISELTVTSSTKHYSVKEGDVEFLLSYGMRRGDVMASEHLIGNSVGLESLAEIPSQATSEILRSGFYLCSWVLILAASFKIGSFFYTR